MANRAECESVVRQLWPFLDGQLPESERERIVRHLENCAACRSHMDFAAEFLAAVALTDVSVDTDLTALEHRIVAALTREGYVAR